MRATLKRNDLVHPELSYEIVGCAYDVYNQLGDGLKEIVYQKAMAICFRKKGLEFKEQVYFEIKFEEETVGKRFLDFVVKEQVVVELKRGGKYSKAHIEQVVEYLKIKNLQLAILINFANDGVITKRIVNLY